MSELPKYPRVEITIYDDKYEVGCSTWVVNIEAIRQELEEALWDYANTLWCDRDGGNFEQDEQGQLKEMVDAVLSVIGLETEQE